MGSVGQFADLLFLFGLSFDVSSLSDLEIDERLAKSMHPSSIIS